MRILHTADWHLGDRLGRQDRTDDLRRAVERVADYCTSEKVDVLLAAGDLFSELAPPEGLRDAIRHLQETFGGFLAGGGVDPGPDRQPRQGKLLPDAAARHAPRRARRRPARRTCADRPAAPGDRPHLAAPARPHDRGRSAIRPDAVPDAGAHLTDEAAQAYQGFDEKNRNLMRAFTEWLRGVRTSPGFHRRCRRSSPPTSPCRAATSRPASASPRRKTSCSRRRACWTSTPTSRSATSTGRSSWAAGRTSATRGSIERLDLGEKADDKGVVLFEVGPEGLRGEPKTLPLEATPMWTWKSRRPRREFPTLEQDYPEAKRAAVRIRCTYTAGVDNREETLRRLEEIFPRWYDREVTSRGRWGGR